MTEIKAEREMNLIELSGTLHDIGFQYGLAKAEDIKKTVEWCLARSGLERTTLFSLVQKLIPYTEAYAPDFLDVIKGIADGAKLKIEEIFFINSEKYALKTMGGCTSFAASGEATSDGETIMGQNYDWIPEDTPEETMLLLRAIPNEGPSYLGLAQFRPGSLALTGINSAGLGVHVNALWYKGSVSPTYRWVPWIAILNKVLGSMNISKAIGAIGTATRSPPPYSLNVLLASRDGNIVDVESKWNDLNVLFPKSGFLVHSNHFETQRFKSSDLAILYPATYIRSNRLTTLMARHHGGLSVDVMKKLLQDHSNYPYSICKHVDEKSSGEWLSSQYGGTAKTLASVISCLGKQKMYVALGNPCENEYLEYKP